MKPQISIFQMSFGYFVEFFIPDPNIKDKVISKFLIIERNSYSGSLRVSMENKWPEGDEMYQYMSTINWDHCKRHSASIYHSYKEPCACKECYSPKESS